MGLTDILSMPKVTVSERLSQLDLFIWNQKLSRGSINIVQTANCIAGVALAIFLFIPTTYLACRKWPHLGGAMILYGYGMGYGTLEKTVMQTLSILAQMSIGVALVECYSHFTNYDRASFMDVYKTMLNPKTKTGFLIGNQKGPLHTYVLRSAAIIAKAQNKSVKELLNQTDHQGRTRLHWAILRDDVDLFEKLLDMDIDLSIGSEREYTLRRWGKLATKISERPLDDAFWEGKPAFLRVAIQKHLESGGQLFSEIVLRSFIDTIARKEEDQQLQISDIEKDLTSLFRQDTQARRYLKEKIDKLNQLNDDKKNFDADLENEAYVLPQVKPLEELYNKSEPT